MLPSLSQQCKGREAPSGVVKHSRATKATPKVSPGPHTGTAGHRPPPPVLWEPIRGAWGTSIQKSVRTCLGSAQLSNLWVTFPVGTARASSASSSGRAERSPRQENHSPPCPTQPSRALRSAPGRTRGNFQLFQRCRSGACARLFLQHGLHSVGSVAIAQQE